MAAGGAVLFIGLSVFGELAAIGLVPALLFAWAAAKANPQAGALGGDSRVLTLLAAVAWAAAAVMQFALAEWSKTVMGAIRADLVVTGPLLAVITYLALSAYSRGRAALA